MTSLEEFYIDQLKDLYNAEIQMIMALSEMAKAATAPELKTAFEQHLEETREHAERLEQILEDIDEEPIGNKCEGMLTLVNEGKKIGEEQEALPEVKDVALIAAAQRIEHFEIAGYGCARAYATLLEEDKAAAMLQDTLDEESKTDEALTRVAEKLNLKAEILSSSR